VSEFLADPAITHVIAVSNQGQFALDDVANKVIWIQARYDEQSMTAVVDQIEVHAGNIASICICHGLLHSETP